VKRIALIFVVACHASAKPSLAHSSAMALSADGKTLFVVNPEADSVSELNLSTRTLTREILLAPAHPVLDAGGNYAPAVMPRAAALSPDGRTLYVSGERSSAVHVVDVASGAMKKSIVVGSEPIGVVVSSDGDSVFVACSQDATVVKIETSTLAITTTATVDDKPWALAWAPDGTTLLVSHFLGSAITALNSQTMTVRASWPVPDMPARGDARLAHGQARGFYDLATRPSTGEIWIAHTLLGTDTAQPALNFESTAFPALSLFATSGTFEQTLSTDAQDVPGIDGAFADVVSGPHALVFTPDGEFVLMADANSEDMLIVDAQSHAEVALVRPLPGHMPEGIVVAADGLHAYVYERTTNDVAVIALTRTADALSAAVDGAVIATLAADPMPAQVRLGQHLFNSSNSDEFALTTDHWISCATCHMEGRSDAVTWKFAQGPRDTPSNAGGVSATGFLFRTADRNQVQQYWKTINVEQGGHFDPNDAEQASQLDAITTYVNFALPLPIPPKTDASLVARGSVVFASAGCASCHSGSHYTDSGAGNPTLDLAGPIVLHDVGTCAAGDVAHEDFIGDARQACAFDTPSLRGVASTAPYLHDGSAPTLEAAIAKMGATALSAADQKALVEFLRSL
jgi:YVTN family beta-propeller protein